MNPPAMSGAIPGGSSSNLKQVKLDRESELRIEVSDEPLRLRVVNGTAEIFGAELPPEIWRTFPPRLKFAVRYGSSISKCVLELLSSSLFGIHGLGKV